MNFISYPAFADHTFVEWVPRNKGGGGGAGFVASHLPGDDIVIDAITNDRYLVKDGKKTRTLLTTTGNHLVETRSFYGLIIDGADAEESILPAVIPCTSTKIKKFRAAMTSIRTVKGRPPLFANILHVKTVLEKHAEGDAFNYEFRLLKDKQLPGPGENNGQLHPLLAEGHELLEMIKSGQATANYESQADVDVSSTDNDSEHF